MGDTTSDLVPWCQGYYNSSYFESNFGQQPFTFNPPEGYTPLCVANLQSPGNARPDQYVKPVIWTGDGVDGRGIPTGFAPDLVWLKRRNGTTAWIAQDTVRGATKDLYTNTSGVEYTDTSTINGFYSEGFNVGNAASVNSNTNTYAAYAWKAGGNSNTWNIDGKGYASAAAAGLTNTTGASVNTESKFGIYKYAGSASALTLSHGLGVAPNVVLVKSIDKSGESLYVFHDVVDGTWDKMYMNLTSGASDASSEIGSVTSTRYTLQTGKAFNADG